MEIFRTENFYVLLCGESSLWINKTNGDLEVKPAWELANGQDPECMGIFFGFIGRIKCPVIKDLILLVKESVIVGELPSGHAVHKIKSVAMFDPTSEAFQDLGLKPCSKHHRSAYETNEQNINNSAISKTWSSLKTATTNIKTSTQQNASSAFTNHNRRDVREREKYQRRIKEELHRIFTDTDSFYFCPAGGDITNSIYRQYLYSEKSIHKTNEVNLDFIDDRFFWNKHMLQDVIGLDSKLSRVWVMPVIQGYVEIKQCKTFFKENEKCELFTVFLISRRSRHRVGTRYKRRGVDECGHCANYVETEQILQYKSHVVSFVQIRGSIPLFWSQQGYKYRPPPQLHKSYEENQIAFEKHLMEEIERYGPIVIVNLVERTGKEAVVGDAYADHICTFNNEQVTYITFDLHHYCRGMKFENVALLIDEIQDEISKMNYCWVDNQGLISKQNGVFRVNCIDCLDRTNIVQTSIAREVMMSQLIKLGLMSPETPYNLLSITQQMYANNGDVISKQYAGTNALKGDITRTGNRKISGLMKDGMNSANRYFRTHYADYYTQTCLDLMQGQLLESENLIVTLVDSVASPLIKQFTPNYPVTLSTEHYAFCNELRITEFMFLVSRYYLSRFKDTTRQATLDIMLGNKLDENIMQQKDSSDEEDDKEESEDSPVNEEENLLTIEHIKQVIDDVKKLLIEDPSSVIAAWALLNADYQIMQQFLELRDQKFLVPALKQIYKEESIQDAPNNVEMDTVLVLTRTSCFVADYDNELDKVTKFQEIMLKYLKLIEIIVWNNTINQLNTSSTQSQKSSPSKNTQTNPILTLHYCPNPQKPNFVLQHNFKSTNLRFFNNIAVPIKNDEERIESLRAIAETIQVAFEVSGVGQLEVNTRILQRKSSLLLPENFRPTDVQLSSLKIVGSKALSNVSQQFSKFNKFGQNFKFSKIKPKTIASNETEMVETCPPQEAFLPTAGIVISNTNIGSVLGKEKVGTTAAENIDDSHNPQIIVEKAAGAIQSDVDNMQQVGKFEKSHSSDHVSELIKIGQYQMGRSTSDKDLSLNLTTTTQEDVSLRSLKSGFTNATNALTSPSSPLTRLAKGVQNLSTNLDPRRLRNVERGQDSFQVFENVKIKEKWKNTNCRSKVIAL